VSRKPQIESVKKNLVIESSESTLDSFASAQVRLLRGVAFCGSCNHQLRLPTGASHAAAILALEPLLIPLRSRWSIQ
jgi:hypothetical protein